MRKILLVPFCVAAFFIIEFLLYNLAGRWFSPNLLLLAIIYFNLAFGIRYSIYTAVCAGLLNDSFSVGIFGLNIFSFIISAYMTTLLKRYLHYVASRRSRLLLVFFVAAVNFLVQLAVQAVFADVQVLTAARSVFLPEILITLLATSFIFRILQKCVSRLFV